MERAQNQLSEFENKIHEIFSEVEDAIVNLRELVSAKNYKESTLALFPRIRQCETQLSKLFVTAYASEVFFRHPSLREETNQVSQSH